MKTQYAITLCEGTSCMQQGIRTLGAALNEQLKAHGLEDRVKVNVLFRGRENAHHERGREILASILETLEEVASVEQPPSMEGGRMMSMVLAPKS